MNTEELKKLAEAATPGPWESTHREIPHRYGFHKDMVIQQARIDPQLKGKYPIVCCAIGIGAGEHGPSVTFSHINEENAAFIAAANPAAILALIAEIDSLRDEINGLTGEIEAAEKALRQSRANDREAMSWIADCKEATGYHGSLMPSFVEYLRDLKQRADK